MKVLKSVLFGLVVLSAGIFFFAFRATDESQAPLRAAPASGQDLSQQSPVSEEEVSVAAAEQMQQQFDNLVQREIFPDIFPGRAQVDVDGFDAALILERRVTQLADGGVQRLFLVNGGGSYPMHRIEELLRFNSDRDVFEVVQQTIIVADHFLVKLKEGKTENDLYELNRQHGTTILEPAGIPGKYIIQMPVCSLDGLLETVNAFVAATGVVARAHVNGIRAPSAIPNDTNWSSLWGKRRIGCPEVWDIVTGSPEIIVAVIDTGVDLDHPDLVDNLWHNAGEIPNNGEDDDGNGYVDDYYGWDFGQSDNDPDDNGDEDQGGAFSEGGHGTHCAGIIGAVGNNGLQVAGVCWNVRIMAVKPFEYLSTYSDMRVYDSKAESAMKYASDHGAKITSNSYGGSGSSSEYYDGIEYQNDRGVLCVCAAGNDSTDAYNNYPSSVDLPNVISVGSSTSSETISYFSNYGSTSVDLFAPGSSIRSTLPDGTTGFKSGTSMAGPQVAGALALLYSYDLELPYLDCKQLLLNNVETLSVYDGKCVSGGRLSVSLALSKLRPTSTFPYSAGFETGFNGWTEDGGDFAWERTNSATYSTGTGPSAAAAGSWFVFTEASGNKFKTARLTRRFGFSLLADPYIDFSYHMYGSPMGTLTLSVSTNNGASWDSLWSLAGNQGDAWHQTNINLQAYSGKPDVTLRFSGYIVGPSSDMALDAITVNGEAIVIISDSDGDIDDDGLPDSWELLYFGDDIFADPAASASNGVNTVMETYIAGLDPTNPVSLFRAALTNADGFIVQWNASSGRVYSVLGSTNLSDSFQPLETNILWPQSSWTDTVKRSESFYQVDVELAE